MQTESILYSVEINHTVCLKPVKVRSGLRAKKAYRENALHPYFQHEYYLDQPKIHIDG